MLIRSFPKYSASIEPTSNYSKSSEESREGESSQKADSRKGLLTQEPAESPRKNLRSFLRATLDFYCRLSYQFRPTADSSPVRFRIKHTLAPLDQLKLKSQVEFVLWRPPRLSMEVKFLKCFKYRIASEGHSFQARLRAPLQLPNTAVTMKYKHIPGLPDSVRLGIHFSEAAFLKIPEFCAGMKAPAKVGKYLKTTVGVKKYLTDPRQMKSSCNGPRVRWKSEDCKTSKPAKSTTGNTIQAGNDDLPRFPAGPWSLALMDYLSVDLKFRCLGHQ